MTTKPDRRVFAQGIEKPNSDEYESDGQDDSQLLQSGTKSQQQDLYQEKDPEEQFKTLESLIFKLNNEDHSEDQGIEDYKIGGYHPCHVGEILINRYVLIQKLGWGHFSTVWLAKDFKFGNYAALKIMKSSPHYLEASYDQVEILQKVAKNTFHPDWIEALKTYEKGKKKYDKDDCHVLNLLNSFLYKGPYGNHFCMVFQILGVNLLQVLKRYDYKGLPLHLVKEITRQVLMGLDFLNRICHVIHTDLKPQNVLLCLTEEEIRKIVEDGHLANKELYKDRLQLYRQNYHLGPQNLSEDEDEDDRVSVMTKIDPELEKKIADIEAKRNEPKLSKNQKKHYRKKLKKYKDKANQTIEQLQKKPQKQKTKKTAKQLFSAFDTKIVMDKGPKLEQGFKVKIADLGNACWQHHHFATEIQTRQYRGPQVILGSKYNISADMWSLACMTFQMLTGELLFNPRNDNNGNFGKNDDHVAQMMQLLGRFPRKLSLRGTKGRKYFSNDGILNRIPKLQNWSLKDVMIAKYRYTQQEAKRFQDFMSPMLNCYPQRRTLANEMLNHSWLYNPGPQNYFMDTLEHEKIRAQRYELEVAKEEVLQYETQKQDASVEDNGQGESSDDEFYGYQKMGDIRYIDRSFMDLGYIGYEDGIFLEKLDTGPNWQFTN